MGAERATKKYCCHYFHDGGNWAFRIDAYDWQDAEARVRKLGNAHLDGEFILDLPARLVWLGKITCWLHNVVSSPNAQE